MKYLGKHGMLMVLAVLAIAVAGCTQPSTNNTGSGTGNTSNNVPDTPSLTVDETPDTVAEPTVAVDPVLTSEKMFDGETMTGMSSPKPRAGRFVHDVTTELKVRVWVVSNEKAEVSLSVNDVEYELVPESRPDLKTKFVSYAHIGAYFAMVPGDTLSVDDNHFVFKVNGEIYEDHMLGLKQD